MKGITQYIIERLGKFKEQEELSLSIANGIYSDIQETGLNEDSKWKITKEFLEQHDFKFVFFNTLHIKQINKPDAGYNLGQTKFNENENMFDKIEIDIDFRLYNTYPKIARVLTHELLHAYEDLQRRINNKETLDDVFKKGSYSKTLKKNYKFYRTMLNNLHDIELRAYMNELTIELEAIEFDINNYATFDEAYKDAFMWFAKNSSFNTYISGMNTIQKLYGASDKEKQKFVNVYNDVYDSNVNFDIIYKRLIKQYTKILKEYRKRILDIFNDYYKRHSEDVESQIN